MRSVVIILLLSLASSTIYSQVINLKTRWKFHVGDNAQWARADFNDSNWEQIRVPSAWEDEGFHGYDGFAWYRIRFDGQRLDASDVYYLNMGYIDDTDEVFLNGVKVGFSGQSPPKFKTAYNSQRKYILPSDVINFKGENVIAVRVFDAIHGGGIVDGQIGIFALEQNTKLLIDLQGIWQFSRSIHGEKIDRKDLWENVMVPAPWEQQGFYKYDGFGWYRKTFTLTEVPEGEELVLILGRIDDFDKTYLNGKLIGQTNDRRPFGMSESYREQRAYVIPANAIKANAKNTIEVLVEDMGNVGGIYEGRIGITTRTNYERYFRERFLED